MSALAAQLANLSASSSGAKNQHKHYVPSLVFASWKEATDLDIDAFFAIGCNGLAGLVAVDAAFSEFSDSLYSEGFKNTDRMLLSKDENKALDLLISRFLVLVSPHFLQPSALKALEWLVRRFKIHEFNVDNLLRSALPFHDTWQFTRVLGTLKFTGKGKWAWLQAFRDKRVSLDRKTLVQRCVSDLPLIQFICDMMEKLLIPNTPNASLCSFFTGTMVELISSTRISDDLMRILMPCLFAMAALDVPNVQAASYMIMAHLSNKAPFSTPIISAISDVVISHASPDLCKYAACCLVSLYDTQEACPSFSGDSLEVLLGKSFWSSVLADVLGVYQGDALVLAIVSSFFEQRTLNPNLSYSNFVDFIKSITLSALLAEKLCAKVLEDAVSIGESGSKEDYMSAKKLLIHISKSFPLVLNTCVAAIAKDSKSTRNDQIFELLSSTFAGTAHEPLPNASTTLYLSLQHADNEIRHIGYSKLIAILAEKELSAASLADGSDFAFIPDVLVAGLKDRDDRIRILIVSNVAQLVEFLNLAPQGPETLIDLVISSRHNPTLLKHAFTHLVQLNTEDTVYGARVKNATLSYFMVEKTTFSLFEHASSTIKSNCKSLHLKALLSGCEALGKELKKAEITHAGKEKEFHAAVSDISDRVVSLVAGNLMKKKSQTEAFAIIADAMASNEIDLARTFAFRVVTSVLQSPQYHEDKVMVVPAVVDVFRKAAGATEMAKFDEGLRSGTAEAKAMLACLTALVASLPAFRKLSPLATTEYYKSIEKDVFEVLLSVRRIQGCHSLVGNLFTTHLKMDSIQFLVNLSLSDDITDAVKAQSLRLISILLQAEVTSNASPKDFQVIFPSLLVGLSRQSKVVREEAVHCVKALAATQKAVTIAAAEKKAVTVFAYDTFYGASSGKVKFLIPATFDRLISEIAETSQEMIADPAQLSRRLSEILFQNVFDQNQSDNILTFLLTSALAFNSANSRRLLLNTLTLVNVPQKIKTLQPLLDIVFGNGETVIKAASAEETALRLTLIDCFSSASVATIFGYKSGRFLHLFLRILTTADEIECLHIIELISKAWFAKIVPFHQNVYAALIEVASKSLRNVSAAAKRALRTVDVSAEVVLNIILACKASIGASDSMQQSAKRSKGEWEGGDGINELITVLELLDSETNVQSRGELIGPLFELLGFILPLDESKVPFSLEYLKQLLITAKLHIVKELKLTGSTVDESLVRIDLIVSCIRVSENPQTHNEALLLMAELAEMFPNTVLLNVIPIFTFMGANILRRDDDYSFHVIQQTLEAIIPPLISKSKSSKGKLDIKSVIEVFIDSIFHVPRHRRLRLFTILVSTLGPSEYLDSVVMMLLLKSSQRFSDIALINPSDIASLSPFCLSLVQGFAPLVQFETLTAITDAVHLLPIDAVSDKDEPIGSVSIDIRGLSLPEVKHFKLVCLDFVNSSLSELVVLKLASSVDIDVLVHQIFQTALVLIVENLGQKAFKLQSNEGKSNFYRSLSKRLNSILSHLNQLMSIEAFLELALDLLSHEDMSIRVRITELTKEKLVDVGVDEFKQNVEVLTSIFGRLLSTLTEEETAENVALKLSSLECVHAIVDSYASSDPQLFANILPTVTNSAVLESENRQIRTAAFDCIGSCITHLGARLIPHIKKIMNSVFAVLKQLSSDLSVDPACVSALATANVAVTVLPQFLSPFVTEILQSTFLTHDKLVGSREVLSKFRSTKRDILSNIAKKIPVRVMIPILSTQVTPCFKLGASATLELFEVASMTIANMEKNDLAVFLNDLIKFFLSSFEFRKRYGSAHADADVDKVEAAIISAYLQLVLRLNESHFKPMFFKIVDWAFTASSAPSSNKANITFLFRLVVAMLDKLKTIFSPYVLHLVDSAVEILNGYKLETAADRNWELIMLTLNKFLQFSSGPVSDEVFTKVAKCLTGQMDLVSLHGRNYLATMTRHVVPAVGLLAVNIGKEAMWKGLNKDIMRKSRSEDVLCRIVTIKAMQEFYIQLGEEFLILLPETVPTIAELMEDSDERVQVAVQELTAEIQKHLGEDLNSYFS
ncbi:HEAT repeat-containing protein 1 [Chytriomyces hyalinus]|nr:HEAT repeat-containing protein 1 [Chytriomyces hyalinus]